MMRTTRRTRKARMMTRTTRRQAWIPGPIPSPNCKRLAKKTVALSLSCCDIS